MFNFAEVKVNEDLNTSRLLVMNIWVINVAGKIQLYIY